MLDPFALDPEFEPWFRQSAALLLGHQLAAVHGKQGFVAEDGRPAVQDPRARFEYFSKLGSRPPL